MQTLKTRQNQRRAKHTSAEHSSTAEQTFECPHPRERFKPQFATTDYITGDKFVVGFCYDCRLMVTNPVPDEAKMARYYPSTYYGQGRRFMPVVEWLLNTLYNTRAANIEGHQQPGRVLDIGCGRGLLLDKLRSRGWEPHGTELSEEAAAFARDSLKLPVTTETIERAGFPSNRFDLVILWHVLEHVRSPRETLREVGRILKPGGTLLVAVPNFGSWEARWSKQGWFHLDVPRHLTQFTYRSLEEALQQAGMTVDTANYLSLEYDFFSFVQTVQNKIGFRHNLLYNLLRTRSARVLDESGKASTSGLVQAVLAVATAVPLGAMSLIYVPLMAFLHKGATMTVYATKSDKE
ncbi:MAG TPA: class I SAM-dependent methyltransferase [Chloroflexia bacterium]|nr:class I SAM-dependent methyltransferase [Chloroflexia bacterium]